MDGNKIRSRGARGDVQRGIRRPRTVISDEKWANVIDHVLVQEKKKNNEGSNTKSKPQSQQILCDYHNSVNRTGKCVCLFVFGDWFL